MLPDCLTYATYFLGKRLTFWADRPTAFTFWANGLIRQSWTAGPLGFA